MVTQVVEAPIRLSVVIPVRDRWDELRDCLDALARQDSAPAFEVIVVDDGSRSELPASLGAAELPFPLRVERRERAGIAAARNEGVRAAVGEILVFIDSDCRADADFLRVVSEVARRHPEDPGFQANLCGDDRDLVGSMEGLRLESVIDCKRGDDGRVAYLNTSGFALRRSYAPPHGQLFDESVVRGEDSLLLAELLGRDMPPRLLEAGTAWHHPRMGLLPYIAKHFRIGYQTSHARAELKRRDGALFTESEREGMLGQMWRRARGRRRGPVVFSLVAIAYGIERVGRTCFDLSSRLGGLVRPASSRSIERPR